MGDSIESSWFGRLSSQDNDTYVIENEDNNGSILPGQSIAIEFIAAKSGDNVVTSDN